ncbi:MAG: hypothetical protein KAG89_12400 [Fulvimarina manganoxydans]|uniref:hypothetical protein n=1 Tax=Fulvimarina manganoxydans TaxID=937218 RepID=UPI0023561BA0|nr:hypothetical protein [Fulvimarina manganoxydans]MCK5932960.1 hypothetical protein [Fulvimarina manganoxydans]
MASLLTGETDVFHAQAAESAGRTAVMFLARRQADGLAIYDGSHAEAITGVLDALAAEGWLLSIRQMIDPGTSREPMALDTGFTHGWDVAGVFEAPSLTEALQGTIRLEKAGWARLFTTEWLIGPREFAPVLGKGERGDHGWAFLALWEWNDQWAAATPAERADYDLECDIAFKGDLDCGVNIAGRHRMDWAHGWHHLGAWEAASPETVDRAITGHETVADFKFTTSRHVLGRLRPLREMIRPSGQSK